MRPIRYEVCKPFVLNAGEAKEIDISIFGLTSDFFDGIIDNEFGDGASVTPGIDYEKLRKFLVERRENMYFEILYYYAGPGKKNYIKLFELKFEETPWRSDAPSNWWAYLQELEDYGKPIYE